MRILGKLAGRFLIFAMTGAIVVMIAVYSTAVLITVGKLPGQKLLEGYALQAKYALIEARANNFSEMNWSSMFGLNKRRFISTALHNIVLTKYDASEFLFDYFDAETEGLPGGYVAPLNSGNMLIANGRGKIFTLHQSTGLFQPVDSNLHNYYLDQDFKGRIIPNLFGRFGLRDLYADLSEKVIYASMFVDISGDGCYGIGIFKADLSQILNEKPNAFLDFSLHFQTEHCNSNFNGHASGGRLHSLDGKLIVTIGSYDLNLYGDASIPQSRETSVGKVIRLNGDGSFEVLSLGHRNQQGLEVVKKQIFITEHGPKGGDEINLISNPPSHYGWPYYAYGFDYDYTSKFLMPHIDPYTKPVYYFTPSIGISQLVYYDDKRFFRWTDKFLVSSLKDRSIYLMDYDWDKQRLISAERIELGHRIRDLEITKDGMLVATTDDQFILTLNIADVDVVQNAH